MRATRVQQRRPIARASAAIDERRIALDQRPHRFDIGERCSQLDRSAREAAIDVAAPHRTFDEVLVIDRVTELWPARESGFARYDELRVAQLERVGEDLLQRAASCPRQ